MTLKGTAPESTWLQPGSAPVSALPHPTSERWQPLRLGLVDLYHYDDEQFWFHDGRLLLRGNNGTGKSKVLALTLPFLLDGSVHPRRVEPDADPKKRMEWNLLLGGAHSGSERIGYAWVEFGRVQADGVAHFLTLGIGLKAAAGRGIVKQWYFTSDRRIGDLRLVDPDRVVLTQERLRDHLASTGSGQVHTTQDAYQRAVDEALFHLGADRYAALIDLLIQLRQPQLSKKPDEKTFSSALTEALGPLDQGVVADVAESFRSLEEERIGISEARETLAAADAFLKHYRAYARVAARRHTTAVREANSAYEWAGRNLREAEEALEQAGAAVQRLDDDHTGATERRSVLDGEREALRESPEMRDAARLDEASRAAGEAEQRAEAAGREADQARKVAAREAERAEVAAGRYDAADGETARRAADAATLAGAAGLAADHEAFAGDEQAARRAVDRRREQVRHVRRLVDAARAAEERAAHRRTTLDAREAEVARRLEETQAADAAIGAAAEAHRDAVLDYSGGLSSLSLDLTPDELAGLAEQWARSQADESPARVAVESAVGTALEDVGRVRAEAEQAERGLGVELAELQARIATLEEGRDPEPPPPPGRDPRARETAAGAPLWRLVDFADTVSDTERAGLEAALHSAGLLDAWVFPDGTLSAAGDVVLAPDGSEVPRQATSLAAALVPAAGPDDEVAATVVAGVLARVGLGEDSGAALWVTPSGQWGAGPARGAWAKERAEYVGAGAREAHRRELLTQFRGRERELHEELGVTRSRIVAADDAAASVRAERAAYPDDSERAVVAAHVRTAAAQRELDHAEQAVVDARQAWEQACDAAAQAAAELADQAGELGLPTTAEALEDALQTVVDYAEALAELRHSARVHAAAEAARDEAAERAAETAAAAAHREEECQDLRSRAARLRAAHSALQDTVGASVAELQARLRGVHSAIERIEQELKRIETRRIEAAGQRGVLEQKVRDLGQRRQETEADRARRIDALRVFATTGLLRVALPELTAPDPETPEAWQVTAALGLARAAEHELDGTDESDDAWSRSQQRASSAATELTSQMSRHGHTAFVEQHGDVLVARVRYLGEEVDVDRLAQQLADDVADRERLLSAREREILENHLVNEVAGHLHELLHAAEEQIDGMNRELAERKTSTGMQLRVRWRERPDGPVGLTEARNLMLRSDATWTAEDRTAIGDFLQAQIAEARQADPTSGWQEHLDQALDYRRWHAFSVERWQNGQWRAASGPASGGEKVLAVSVPLFAAASAHYNSAGPLAPRLILLDEAFAGVDDDSRAKSLGLLATFDLDVVMTSEREWGCYPQVPGLSIAQLSRVEGIDAVGVTRWRWDGRRRERLGEIDQSARAVGESVDVPGGDSLFG